MVSLFPLLAALLVGAPGCDAPQDMPAGDAPERTDAEDAAKRRAGGEDGQEILDGIDRSRGLSRDAKLDTYKSLKAHLEIIHHASDGGGRAWLTHDPGPLPASSRQRLEMLYEAGPLGIALGGAVYLQTSPFWGWDQPQGFSPDSPGYSEVLDVPEGIELEIDDGAAGMLVAWIRGRELRPGERLRFVYGAGSARARVDRYAETESPIYLSVDGDGDGIRKLVANPPTVDIVGRAPRQIRVKLPSTAEPGDTIRVTISALDASLSPASFQSGSVVFGSAKDGLTLPSQADLGGRWGTQRTLEIKVEKPGIYRVQASGRGDLEGITTISNPLLVREEVPRLLWGDFHGHSQLSDGTGSPEQYFDYARNVSGLDVVALTDHDHWGMDFLDSHPEFWSQIKAAVARAHVPGVFVSLLGYEWTSWLHGHRHVLYFTGEGEIFSTMDPRYETPDNLWDALRGQAALTFAHHSAGGPISTNWLYPPDPELEPITEIASVHGSSEALDAPGFIYNPVEGNFVRDALDAGYPLGFIGSGDSHDGHPGMRPLTGGGGLGGLAGIYAEDLTRDAVLEALRARRVYATNGVRIVLRVDLDGHPMGTIVPTSETEKTESTEWELEIEIVAQGPIEKVDLIRSGQVSSLPGEGRTSWHLRRSIPALKPGEYHYVRVVQEDLGAAWSSPILAR